MLDTHQMSLLTTVGKECCPYYHFRTSFYIVGMVLLPPGLLPQILHWPCDWRTSSSSEWKWFSGTMMSQCSPWTVSWWTGTAVLVIFLIYTVGYTHNCQELHYWAAVMVCRQDVWTFNWKQDPFSREESDGHLQTIWTLHHKTKL